MKTHIRLERSDREDATALLIPIAGTVFELTANYQTLAVLPNGKTYPVDESINEIAEAIDTARTEQDLT
jgi:hypothetical protein